MNAIERLKESTESRIPEPIEATILRQYNTTNAGTFYSNISEKAAEQLEALRAELEAVKAERDAMRKALQDMIYLSIGAIEEEMNVDELTATLKIRAAAALKAGQE